MEIVLLVWVLLLATMWLARILAEELWSAIRGKESPRIGRRRAREQLARDTGNPTVGQALAFRVAQRIAHPPKRRWASALRGLLDEVWADALAEARLRHQRAHEARMRTHWARRPPQGAPFHAETGTDGPATPAAEDVVDTRPCRYCGIAWVVEPEEFCTACEEQPWPAPTDPDPADNPPRPQQTDDNPQPDERKAIIMATATHTINGDVRDPRTALAFATSCRGFNDAAVRELDILANNMRQVGLGPGPIGEIRVLADAARSYSASNSRSVKTYAQHVVTQQDIAYDDDLKNTVRRTYLDTHGSDAVAPPQGQTVKTTLSAADARTPAAGVRFMKATAVAYAALKSSVDTTMGNHQRQRVSDGQGDDRPVAFLREQLEYATVLADKADRAARTFERHIKKMQDTVGKNKSLHGTQKNKYLDPAKA